MGAEAAVDHNRQPGPRFTPGQTSVPLSHLQLVAAAMQEGSGACARSQAPTLSRMPGCERGGGSSTRALSQVCQLQPSSGPHEKASRLSLEPPGWGPGRGLDDVMEHGGFSWGTGCVSCIPVRLAVLHPWLHFLRLRTASLASSGSSEGNGDSG